MFHKNWKPFSAHVIINAISSYPRTPLDSSIFCEMPLGKVLRTGIQSKSGKHWRYHLLPSFFVWDGDENILWNLILVLWIVQVESECTWERQLFTLYQGLLLHLIYYKHWNCNFESKLLFLRSLPSTKDDWERSVCPISMKLNEESPPNWCSSIWLWNNKGTRNKLCLLLFDSNWGKLNPLLLIQKESWRV